VVLGAGIIGVCIAIGLQKRGREVVLIDRGSPGQATSFGNAGLIQREAVYPYAFPRELGTLLRYAANQSIDVRFHVNALFKLAPFLARYWKNSHPSRHAAIARQYATLIEHSVVENRSLAAEANVSSLLRNKGWLKVYREAATEDLLCAEAELLAREFRIQSRFLDRVALKDEEPDLSSSLLGGLHYTDADSTVDPGELVTAYFSYFKSIGGRFLRGDASMLAQIGDQWAINTDSGNVLASSAVIALGPWSDIAVQRLGYRLRLAVKRGYHMHYGVDNGAVLNHPVLDVDRGFLLAPMARGVRLTTGVELALAEAKKTPVQLSRAEPFARALFPIGQRLDEEPWMGLRPCTPDMLPVIGPAPNHKNLWFAFGHAHHGLTLGAVTGRLIAEMVTGEQPFIDPAPFRADRRQLS
jgi:D-amino-acid dehydrogenase